MSLDCGPCVLRMWDSADRRSLVENANNRNVWRNLTHRFPHPYTEADADSWLQLTQEFQENTQWAIDIDGEAVGGIGVILGEGVYSKTAQFGYWLGEPFWGRGVMTSAARVASDHVMAQHDLVRLEAPVFEWNPASMRVLEKCGFAREGTLRRSVLKDGEIIDSALYARVR